MPKKIVFCADGTWQTPSSRTNVYRLFKALLVTSNQMPFYDDGVGADGNFIFRLIEGAAGVGVRQKVKDGYTKIAHVYESGDQIYLFGFSRGAFTARALAGMIAACGLPTSSFSDDLVNTAFQAYANPHQRDQILKSLTSASLENAKIDMVGVWDTVGSIGLTAVLGTVDPIDEFFNLNLTPNILHAYHALAIDEKRPQFQPTLWNAPFIGQTLEQVWFPGFHGDVGGGAQGASADDKLLSDVPLAWMMKKAADLGLQFDPLVTAMLPLPMDSSYALLPTHPFDGGLNEILPRTITNEATIADIVVLRAQQHGNPPHNLKFKNGALASTYSIEKVLKPFEAGAVI